MNTVVVLRAVRDPASFTVNRRAEKIFVHREQYICNPADLNALEAALRIRDRRVTVVSYGGAPAEGVLRMARAMGAGRAILVDEPTLQNADAAVITDVLCAVIGSGDAVDLVLTGDEVLDGDYAQVAPRLAEALGWPFVESALVVETMDEGRMTTVVRRARGYGALAVELPAVVSVARDSNRVRYAPAPGVITYFRQDDAIERVALESLGVIDRSAPPFSIVAGESYPPERKLGEVLDGALPETLMALEEMLRATTDEL
jgi:electron transfer flavoprotein beta subunit